MLRDYQIDICARVREAFRLHRSVMVQMPTGTGKTVVLASLVGQSEGVHVLVVAHRRELMEQIRATVRRMRIGGDTMVVESIQTLSRRVGALDFIPSLVVIDEAHHALARTYKRMWEAWPEAKFLGLTATPCRLNGQGFTDLFEVLVQSWDIPTFIREKWLATYDFVSIKADSRTQQLIGSLKKRGADGDYQVKEMGEVLNRRPSIERLYQGFVEYGRNRKGFVYAINIDHARSIAEYYRGQGVEAVAIDGRTPAKERQAVIERFRVGAIQVLVNVDIFSEGFDCPDVEFIQLARPTLSLAKYLQMVGRGLRPGKGKKNCMILDNVGLYRVFGLPSQRWDWEGMFRGRRSGMREDVRLKMKEDGWRMLAGNYPSSFILPQALHGEMYLVVSHEQLDATFERQKKDEELERKRARLLDGGYGHVRIVGRQLAELRDTRSGLPSYVDLLNMNWFCHVAGGRPTLVRWGDVDFLKSGSTLVSRTRVPIRLSCYRESVRKHSFYTTHVGPDKANGDCMSFYEAGFRYGSKVVVFLHDEPLEYFWKSCRLQDGGLVVMGTDGGYYYVQKGQPKVYLGCADTEEDKTRLTQTVHALIREAGQRREAKRQEFQRDVESLEYVKPFRTGAKWGLRGSDGRVLALPRYRSIQEENGYFLIEELPLHWGVMDRTGRVRVEPKHDKVEITPDGRAILSTVTGRQTVVELSERNGDGYTKKLP